MKPAYVDAATPLHRALGQTVLAALEAAGIEGYRGQIVVGDADPIDADKPYVVIGNSTSTESAIYEDKDSRPLAMTASAMVYARNHSASTSLANDIAGRMTSGISVDGFDMHQVGVQRSGTIQRTTEDYAVYQQALTFTLALSPA